MKNFLKPLSLLLITVMLLTQSFSAFSAVGSYTLNSKATSVNYNSVTTAKEAAWPAIAAGIVLGVVFAVGVIDGWNSIHAQLALGDIYEISNYNSDDFSKFDN